MIPKILHQVWTGTKTIPGAYNELVKQFQRTNPDWQYNLWTDSKIDSLNLDSKKLYEGKPPIVKADIARYEILFRFGGIYADVDFYFCKSLNGLIKYDFVGTTINTKHGVEIYNGMFGCNRENRLIRKVIHEIDPKEYNESGFPALFHFCGTYHFTDTILEDKMFSDKRNRLLPASLFYGWPVSEKKDNVLRIDKIKPYIKPETYAIHLWWGTWM